jgi:DNA-binding HxlR family transcriptional regulator
MASRSYEQYCPVATSLDVVGDRWALLIVRELMVGRARYTDLKAHLGKVPPNILATRLRELEDHGLVERVELPPPASRTVYQLTPEGFALAPVIRALVRFGFRRMEQPADDVSPAAAIPSALLAYSRPDEAAGVRRTWRIVTGDDRSVLRLRNGTVDFRMRDEDADLDVIISAPDLYRIRIGSLAVADAKRSGALRYEPDDPALIDEFESVFQLEG